jgi:hypothetical protein
MNNLAFCASVMHKYRPWRASETSVAMMWT